MLIFRFLAGAALLAAVLSLLISLLCFFLVFYVPRRRTASREEFSIPPGAIYEPHRDRMVAWMKQTRSMPHEDVSIRSFDGLTLCGSYYEFEPGAPIELMFHGYRGTAERDLCGGVQRCFTLGRSALIVDQRAGGRSEGHVITFGVNESRDCLAWVDFMIKRFGPDVKIILTGISMGAATVLTAAGKPLPKNVIGVLADCGYTSAKDIIREVMHQMKLPPKLLYPFVKLGARLYGRFDLEEASPIEALKTCRVPVFFVHGEADDFVPCAMSRSNYSVCPSQKQLLTVPGAGHGLSYLIDGGRYLSALAQFNSAYGLAVPELQQKPSF